MRAVGERSFVSFEELSGGFWSGSYDARDRAQKEVDDGSVTHREFAKSLMRDRTQKVEVSYDG